MHGQDDKQLGAYLAAFSDAGSVPTSLGGYGYNQQRHGLALGGFGDLQTADGAGTVAQVGSVPTALRKTVPPGGGVAVRTAVLQQRLTTLGLAPGKSGSYDSKTKTAWGKFSRVFQTPAPTWIGAARPQGAPGPDFKWTWVSRTGWNTLVTKSDQATKRDIETGNNMQTKAAPPAPRSGPNASTDEVQKIMLALGVDPTSITDGKFGPTTKAKWQALAKSKKLNPAISGRTGAIRVTVNHAALSALRALAVASAPVAAADHVTSTNDVQSILLRLGARAPGNALTDGLYGPTTAGFWAQSAEKRGLDPFMAKKSMDGKTVIVRKNTYFTLLADADTKVPPTAVQGLKSMDPSLVSRDSKQAMAMLLNTLEPTPGPVITRYQLVAKRMGVDAAIEEDSTVTGPCGNNGAVCPTYLMMKASLAAMVKQFQTKAAPPPQPPPGPEKTQLELGIEKLLKDSTASVAVTTVRTAINAAIQAKKLPGPALPPAGPWETGMQNSILAMLGITGPSLGVWQNALAPGKLVSADGKTLKLPAPAADSLRNAAAAFAQAKQEEKTRYVGFTEVNAAEVVARINGLGSVTKKFDRSGGPKELADAIRTFLVETGRKAPPGDLVRTDPQAKTYVKNSVLASLAEAVSAAQQRASVTKAYRDRMVMNAMKSATGKMSVREYQQAVRETILSKQKIAATTEKLFKAVTITGAFDKPTRAAYTETARTVIIGPAVQEYQRLLGEQKRYTTAEINALVTEARNQVWNSFLEKSVIKQNGSLMMSTLPNIANLVALGAKQYQKNTGAQERQAEEALALTRALEAAVKRSTAILSITNVQQGLKQMAADGSFSTALSITGTADAPTRSTLLEVNGMIFPEGFEVPETTWARYLSSVGFVVVAGQVPKRAWVAANYIALPPALADLLAKQAGKWIAANGQPLIQVVEFQHPSVVTVKMPPPKDVVFTDKEAAKKIVESPKPAAKTGEEEQEAAQRATAQQQQDRASAQEQALLQQQEASSRAQLLAQQAEQERLAKESAIQEAANAEAAAQAAAQREQAAKDAGDVAAANQAAAEAQQAAAMAAQQTQEAQAALAREQQARSEQRNQETAAQAGGAQVTGPTIQITTTAAPPLKAGMGFSSIAALVGAAIALATFARGDGQGEA